MSGQTAAPAMAKASVGRAKRGSFPRKSRKSRSQLASKCQSARNKTPLTQDATMMKNINIEDFQKLGQHNMDAAMKVFGEWNKGWQAIAAEMSDYTKRSFEEGTATFEKLLSAKSVEQAIEIQSGFAKRAYDGYMHQLSKIGGMYAELAKEAYKPVEKALQGAR